MPSLFQALARQFKIFRWILLQTLQHNIVAIRSTRLFAPTTQPDAWKVIAHRRYLYPARIFKPKNINDASRAPLPLAILVHGGGFVMNLPAAEDALARLLADSCGCITASVDYRKAPRYPFPAAYEDVVASIKAIIDDEGLKVDTSRVVLYGSSAGGNLVLAAAQDPALRGRIRAIAAAYPAVNLAAGFEEQMARRPDPSVADFVGEGYNDVREMYGGGADERALRDRRISPTFFEKREDLPEHVFIMGCEHDLLCHEARVMAEKLIGIGAARNVKDRDEWKAGGVRWELMKGQTHAFDRFPAKTAALEEKRVRDRDILWQDVADWLREVYGSS